MKKRKLLRRLIKEQIFGRVVVHVCVKEFQKCGLVHSNIIFILYEPFKSALRNLENIAKLVSTEIPGESESSIGEQVFMHIFHCPCSGNASYIYKKPGGNSSGSKSFQKRFQKTTRSADTNHFVEHQRGGPEFVCESGLVNLNTEDV